MNDISGNGKNGVLVSGKNCNPTISANIFIGLNKECGIKCERDSIVCITNNFISKNSILFYISEIRHFTSRKLICKNRWKYIVL